VTPVKVKKEYKYIPKLIAAIFEARKESDVTLRYKRHLPDNHPANIRHIIAHYPPLQCILQISYQTKDLDFSISDTSMFQQNVTVINVSTYCQQVSI